MGTRHLIAVVYNNGYKIAQYGQWDGYPSGQGFGILEFLRNRDSVEKLKSALGRVRFYDAEGRDKDFIDEYNKNAPEWSNEPDNRTEEQKRWWNIYMSRDLGSEILENVSKSEDEEILLRNSIDFAYDSLFCEWAYVIDLDKNMLEVYEGFNKETIAGGRFPSSKKPKKEEEYEPVRLVQFYFFDDLPTNTTFLRELCSTEDNH